MDRAAYAKIIELRSKIVGQKIVDFDVTDDGQECPVLVLSTGDMLVIQCDPEGNGPGHVAYIKGDG
jgi:hypothetical protein